MNKERIGVFSKKKLEELKLPCEWKIKPLKDLLVKTVYGISDSTKGEGDLPVLRMGNIVEGKVDFSDLVYVDEYDNFEKDIIKNGEILFNRTNSYDMVGKSAIADFDRPTICASYIVRLIVNRDVVLPEYLVLYMNTRQAMNELRRLSTKGVQQSNINPTLLQRFFYVPVPTLKEQKIIVELLSRFDSVIELKKELFEEKKIQLDVLKRRVLSGEIRINGFVSEWNEIKLENVVKGRNESNANDLELLSITSSNGVIPRKDIKGKDNSSLDKSKYKKIYPLDIGYNTMRMWQGVSGVSEHTGIVSPAYTILTPTSEYNSYFLGYFFKLPQVVNLFYRYSQGMVNDTLNLKYSNLKQIRVSLPSEMKEQEGIVKILKKADKEIALLHEEIHELKLQRKGTIESIMIGKTKLDKLYS